MENHGKLRSSIFGPSLPDIEFQIALVPSEHIKPEKAIGLTRKS